MIAARTPDATNAPMIFAPEKLLKEGREERKNKAEGRRRREDVKEYRRRKKHAGR